MSQNYIFIKDAFKSLNDTVTIKGWVYNFRSSKGLFFLQVRDGSGFMQAVVSEKDVSSQTWAQVQNITLESSIEIVGKITAHPKKENVFELQANDVKILQIALDYPIAKKEHGPDFLLDNRHLWLRSQKQWAIQRIRNIIINATYEYFEQNGFIKIDSPILTPSSCEDTTELFEINYFDYRKAYLSQSGQLYLEAAIMAHGKVFDFGPVFRAEKSKTRRHLIEFWMMDAEMAFHDYEMNMKVQEELICHIVKRVLEKGKMMLEILERNIPALEKINPPFIHKTHADVVKELRAMGSDIKEDDDLGADDETMLCNKYDKPIFVAKYPAKVKAFYMKRDPQDPAFALCSDLLAPEGYGEIIGGSQREDDYDALVARLKEYKLNQKDFQWYLDLRKYGSVPHSGFGYGLERIVAWICGIHHVRETIPFPRLLNRIYP